MKRLNTQFAIALKLRTRIWDKLMVRYRGSGTISPVQDLLVRVGVYYNI